MVVGGIRGSSVMMHTRNMVRPSISRASPRHQAWQRTSASRKSCALSSHRDARLTSAPSASDRPRPNEYRLEGATRAQSAAKRDTPKPIASYVDSMEN
jgi:hypothetical protein